MPRRANRALAIIAMLLFAATACASSTDVSTSAAREATDASEPNQEPATTVAVTVAAPAHPDDWPGVTDIPDVYNPFAVGEATPDGYRQLLRRDLIAPIYDPKFVPSTGVPWPNEELVLGVFLNDEARAYPIGLLNQREIVIDIHRGIPTLVTW